MSKEDKRLLLDLEKLNTLNEEGCPACGKKFEMGDVVVPACGPWGQEFKYIHEKDAVYDPKTDQFYERRAYSAQC